MAIRASSDNLSLDHPASEAAESGATVLDFSELWAHREALRHVCGRMVGNADTAEDLVQDTYLRALRLGNRLERRGSVAPWLATVARRRSIDELRRRQRISLVDLPAEPAAATGDDPAQRVLNQELVDRLRLALAGLSPRERKLLLRQVSHGLSLAELAAEESSSVASVRSVLARARHKLRTSLERGGVLGGLSLRRSLGGLRHRLHRYLAHFEGALPWVGGPGWQLGQILMAAVAAVVVLIGNSLPSAEPSTIAVTSSEAGAAHDDRPAEGSADGGGARPGGSRSGERVSPSTPAVLPDGVDLPDLPSFPNEGVDQPEQTGITELAASPDGTVVFAGGTSGSYGLPVLYRSTDRGHTWEKVGADQVADVQRHRTYLGGTLLVSPAYADDRRVFALGAYGLQWSTDGGETFVGASPARGSAVFSPSFANDETIFFSGPPPAAYNADLNVMAPFGGLPPSSSPGGIALGPDHATTGELLIGGLTQGGTPALFTCTAATCATRAVLPSLAAGPEVLVSETMSNVVLVRARNKLLRSTDGGATFSGLSVPSGFSITRLAQGGDRLFVLGRNTSTATSSSGLLMSDDDGATWAAVGGATALGKGVDAFVALADGRIISSAMVTGGLLCSDDDGGTWATRCSS